MNILIVVDMQNDFINGTLGTKEAKSIIESVSKKIEAFEGQVIFTQDTHLEDYLDSEEGKHLPIVHCQKGTKGWRINSKIKKSAKGKATKTILKDTFGAKKLIPLLNKIHSKTPINYFELVGLCTDICVISNALLIKAYFPNIPISVDGSCCAGITPESHQNALEAMKMCQININ